MTADEKETDIRLRSTRSPLLEGVIEIKIGEKSRSAADLCKALSLQLVDKYLKPETRRAGVLLITVGTERRWVHPVTAEQLDPAGLTSLLNREARRIMDDGREKVVIAARVLDLRPKTSSERATRATKRLNRLGR